MTLGLLPPPFDPILIDNSPEREFDDIQPGDPAERREVDAEKEEEARERPPADADGRAGAVRPR
jgi:hypothetical protein